MKATDDIARKLYRRWLQEDMLPPVVYPAGSAHPSSQFGLTGVREFIKYALLPLEFTRGHRLFTPRVHLSELHDLDGRFGDWLSLPVTASGQRWRTLGDVARHLFVENVVDDLAHELGETVRHRGLRRELHEQFLDELGGRPLRSFFFRRRTRSGYFAKPGWPLRGRRSRTRFTKTPSGVMRFRLSAYNYEPPLLYPRSFRPDVVAYEWRAQLCDGEGRRGSEAVAAGTLYRSVRHRGEEADPRLVSHWLEAASNPFQEKAWEVSAFINQDVESDEAADICFVSTWERRLGSSAGIGRRCLELALQLLKRRFRWLGDVVVDLKPAQFAAWDGLDDPPQIRDAKQECRGRLRTLSQGLNLTRSLDLHTMLVYDDFPHPNHDTGQLIDWWAQYENQFWQLSANDRLRRYDRQAALCKAQCLAGEGDPVAALGAGQEFLRGEIRPSNKVEAAKWFIIALATANDELRLDATRELTRLSKTMSLRQSAEARTRALDWLTEHGIALPGGGSR